MLPLRASKGNSHRTRKIAVLQAREGNRHKLLLREWLVLLRRTQLSSCSCSSSGHRSSKQANKRKVALNLNQENGCFCGEE